MESSDSNGSSSGGLLSIASVYTPMILVLGVWWATPLAWRGPWDLRIMVPVVLVVVVVGTWWWSRQAHALLDDQAKWKIRFHVMEAADVVQVLVDDEAVALQQPKDDERRALVLTAGLASLAKKYNAVRVAQRQRQQEAQAGGKGSDETKSSNPQTTIRINELALLCQEAAYIGLRFVLDLQDSSPHEKQESQESKTPTTSSTNHGRTSILMDVSEASIALLALVAKNEMVRERHLHQADIYGLDAPTLVIRRALDMGKDMQNDKDGPRDDDDSPEQAAAELQRKACLLLGALAEGNADLAQLVAGEGGMEIILHAAQWYRFHAAVANWALWALFILCFEHTPNKATLVEADGVALAIDLMRNCPESLEVARHGVALIFDLMRENPEARQLDVWGIRKAALSAGLHDVLVQAMKGHADAMDIMMMGSELLVGTGYEGEIPTFQPPEMNTIDR